MSSLSKFENKLIDHTTKDLLRSFISNAQKELDKVHKACGFGDNVEIVADRKNIQVSLVGEAFKLVVSHGADGHTTKISLYKHNAFIRNILIQNLHHPNLAQELRQVK